MNTVLNVNVQCKNYICIYATTCSQSQLPCSASLLSDIQLTCVSNERGKWSEMEYCTSVADGKRIKPKKKCSYLTCTNYLYLYNRYFLVLSESFFFSWKNVETQTIGENIKFHFLCLPIICIVCKLCINMYFCWKQLHSFQKKAIYHIFFPGCNSCMQVQWTFQYPTLSSSFDNEAFLSQK